MEIKLVNKLQGSIAERPADYLFDTEYLKVDLKGRSIRGGAATMSGQAVKFFLHTGSTVVLARMLTPKDFGLVAMVIAITSFVMMFKDMGLSMATVQKAEINHAQISTLFWINAAIGVALAAVTAALAPAIAWFYGEPRLMPVTVVLALAFVFVGLTIQHQALLRRHMRFVTLAIVEVISLIVGIGVAITAAWMGAGYWSLVYMHLVMATTGAVGVWLVSSWWPGWPRWRTGVRSMLAFGRDVTGFSVINYFARNFDKILVGRFCGPGILGLYSKAYSLLMLPINQIRGPLNAVAVPALSRIQDEPKRYISYCMKLFLMLSFVSMPLTVFLAVCSKSIIHLLLGDQWVGASRIFQILAITAFIQPVASTRGLVLLSLGQSGRYLRFGIFNSVVVVTSFVIGIRWGAIGVATAYAAANYFILFPSLWYCFRLTPVSVATFLKAIAKPTVASSVTALVVWIASIFLTDEPDIVLIGSCLVIGLLVYFLIWSLLPGGLHVLRDLFSYFRVIFRSRTRSCNEQE